MDERPVLAGRRDLERLEDWALSECLSTHVLLSGGYKQVGRRDDGLADKRYGLMVEEKKIVEGK